MPLDLGGYQTTRDLFGVETAGQGGITRYTVHTALGTYTKDSET